MKTIKLITVCGLALASVLTPASLRADTLNPSQTTDLILFFHPTGGTGSDTDLFVDLGNFATFTGLAPGATINLVGSNGLQLFDLSSKYGSATTGAASTSSWDNRTASTVIQWGVVGATGASIVNGTPRRTLFGTSVSNSGTYSSQSQANQTTFSGAIDNWINGLNGSATTNSVGVNGANGSTKAIYISSSDQTSSFNAGSGGSSPYFGFFADPPFLNTTNVANGSVFSELYEIEPTGNNPSVIDLGHFTLSATGFSFTAAIPEPSTWASMIIGAVLLIVVQYRRRKLAKS